MWPFVDEWLAWFDTYASGSDGGGDDDDDDDDHVKNESHIRVNKDEDEADRQDLAAQGLVRQLYCIEDEMDAFDVYNRLRSHLLIIEYPLKLNPAFHSCDSVVSILVL